MKNHLAQINKGRRIQQEKIGSSGLCASSILR
jgi:hypothetical protein